MAQRKIRRNTEQEDLEKINFPKCNEILRKRSKESFLKDFDRLKQRLDYFKYLDTENLNDIREGYLQFMDDADTFLKYFHEIILDIIAAMKYYEGMKEHAKALAKVSAQYEKQIEAFQTRLIEQGIDPIEPLRTVAEIEDTVSQKAQELLRRNQELDEVEQEIAITADTLARKKSEMEEALKTRYTLTDCQRQTLLEEKDLILDGIEEWGSVSGAVAHNPRIKSKVSTIMMYTQMFPEFGEAIKVSQAMFKDRLEAIMVERAIEGTENPVFGKGEHIGDYKIKDNKLFMELMKAKVPEEYNKKSVESIKNQQVNNMNIISFANVDETKEGFTRDVGVVVDVDSTGKVSRITQEKKMLEYYANKEGAEIIMPDEQV